MNFGPLGKLFIDLGFPILGAALGVPQLAPIAASLAKQALGLDDSATADDLGAAARANPGALSAAESEAAARWAALAEIAKSDAEQARAVNETMRKEVAAGRPWWAWRNLWGYSVTLECILVSLLILHELFTGDFKAVTAFTDLSGFFLAWYGMRIGILGHVVSSGTRERTAAVTGAQPPSLLGDVVKAVVRRR
jgi:hypothetical protein